MFKNRTKVDMVNGPLLSGIIRFSIPIMLSGMLQLMFSTVNIIVVGQFSGEQALAAVGSTNSLINLIVNLFIGISVGTSVVFGRYLGANDRKSASETVNSAMFVSCFGGIIIVVFGLLFAEPLLLLTGVPADVIGLTTQYMRAYFLGVPGLMIYNYGAALFRATGDTKRPLYFLTVSGVVNATLNVILVTVFHLDVLGVGLATAISQYVAAAFILLSMKKTDSILHCDVRNMKFYKDKFYEMLRYGLPAGIQSSVFNISNVLIQSSVNSFGSTVVAGNTTANNIESFVYNGMIAFYHTSLSFTSQNVGAKRYDRVGKILRISLSCVVVVGCVMGMSAYAFGESLLGIYSSNQEVISYGMIRLGIVCFYYFLCGIMDVLVGSIRGLGYSITPMIVSLTGACAFRIIWILTVFKAQGTLESLYISYPISWLLTASVHGLCYFWIVSKNKKQEVSLKLSTE